MLQVGCLQCNHQPLGHLTIPISTAYCDSAMTVPDDKLIIAGRETESGEVSNIIDNGRVIVQLQPLGCLQLLLYINQCWLSNEVVYTCGDAFWESSTTEIRNC